MNPEGYAVLLQDLGKDAPNIAAAFRANLPPERFTRDDLLKMVASISDKFSRTYAPLDTKVVQNDDGTFAVARTGGFDKPGVFQLPQYNLRQGGAARPAPQATGGVPPQATGGVPLQAAGTPAPQATGTPAPQATGSPPPSREDVIRNMLDGPPLPPDIMRDNGFRPMSMTTGGGDPAAQQDLAAIVQTMMQTGVISQSGLDAMRAAAPGKEDQLAQILRENDIQILPDEGEAPGMRNAVFRPGEDAMPERQNVQSMDDYYATGQAARGRDLNQGAIPGIYNVPTQDVAAASRATRPSKQELYDAEAAKLKAVRDAGPPPLTSQQKIKRKTEVAQAYTQTQGLINKTYDPKEGVIALARKIKMLSNDQKEAITGFSNYVPSFRESTREADTLFGNLKGVITAAGKDAAAASGAIGPMAVQEWKIAADMIANLDLAGMTPRALDAQMDRIIRQVSNATNLAQQVYDVQYGDDVKEYPAFKVKGGRALGGNLPVGRGGTRISPDIDKILKSRGI